MTAGLAAQPGAGLAGHRAGPRASPPPSIPSLWARAARVKDDHFLFIALSRADFGRAAFLHAGHRPAPPREDEDDAR